MSTETRSGFRQAVSIALIKNALISVGNELIVGGNKMVGIVIERGRISARCAKEQQEKINTAAALSGATLNQFVLQASLEKAEQVIERERMIAVNAHDAAMIIDMLENPPEHNAALSDLLATYRKKVENGVIHSSVKSTSSPSH